MQNLLAEVDKCRLCEASLSHVPRPVVQLSEHTKILIIGQAPGLKVHKTGIPWDDPSGEQLRMWMGVNKDQFYDSSIFGLLPMGFCYPGKGTSGDLPPRPECAPKWHEILLSKMQKVELTLLIGQYAHKYYLGDQRKSNLTETVKHFKEYLPNYLPLVHPSPRNRIWQKKNPWFALEVVPYLSGKIAHLIG